MYDCLCQPPPPLSLCSLCEHNHPSAPSCTQPSTHASTHFHSLNHLQGESRVARENPPTSPATECCCDQPLPVTLLFVPPFLFAPPRVPTPCPYPSPSCALWSKRNSLLVPSISADLQAGAGPHNSPCVSLLPLISPGLFFWTFVTDFRQDDGHAKAVCGRPRALQEVQVCHVHRVPTR
jgi:hypothetical protein